MKLNILTSLILVTMLMSCTLGRQAYYSSPFNGISPQYRTVPVRSDSIRSATYLNATLSAGSDNESGSDPKHSLTTGISRGHNFKNFQARYGANLSIGSYRMKPYDSIGNHESVNHRIINQNAGKYFFGGAGLEGGFNFVTSTNKGEWRVIGVETSLFHEFGDYLEMREQLPDSAATVIIRNKFYGSAGLFTEYIGGKGKTKIGGKIGGGYSLGSPYNNIKAYDSYYLKEQVKYRYFTFVFHVSTIKWTIFFQSIFGGKSGNALIGMNYRIGKQL